MGANTWDRTTACSSSATCCEALLGRPYRELSSGECAALMPRFEHKVSGHDARAGPAHAGEAVCRLLAPGAAVPVPVSVAQLGSRPRRTIYTQ